MSLFKREPRTVYRVYGEDEYFGHEQPAEAGGLEVTPAVEHIGVATGDDSAMVERARSEEEPPLTTSAEAASPWEPAPLPYRGPAHDLRPLAVGLLAAAIVGVLALVAVATLGKSSSRAPRAAAVTAAAPGSAETRGGGATTSGGKSGAEWASRARTRVRTRVTNATTSASRVGRSRAGLSRTGSSPARAHRPPREAGRASVSFTGARPAAVAPVPAGLAGAVSEANSATPASRATAEFGFER